MSGPTLEEAVERFLTERQGESPPTPEAFAARYPAWRDELLSLLPLLPALDGLAKTAVSRTVWADLPLPAPLGEEFLLLRRLGVGGMGVVFEAEQRPLGRRVAIKVLSGSLAAEAAWRERFAREGALVARLHHPNIVQVHCAGTLGGTCYYAMELVSGKGLDGRPAQPPRRAAEWCLQAARALAYAHGCGVLHCDVKPANLLLDAGGTVRVGDFGLACVPGAEPLGGTFRYLSPERLAGGAPTAADDLYALGLTLHELVAGHSPFAGLEPRETADALRRGEVPPLCSGASDLDAIAAKCLCREPARRYPSMEALADDLRRFLAHEPVRARPALLPRRLALWARRRPGMAVLSAVALLSATAYVGAMAVGYRRTASALALADGTLDKVFAHVGAQPPSRRSTGLLSALLPYSQSVTEQRGLPAERLATAHRIVGDAALRLGDFGLAESSYRHLHALTGAPHDANLLAKTLCRQGRTEESTALFRRVAEGADPLEAAKASQALGETERAFAQVCKALTDDPRRPEARFVYAMLLGDDPRRLGGARVPGVEPNAAKVLHALVAERPDDPEVGVGFLTLSTRRLRRGSPPEEEIALALDAADRLVAHRPNDPEVVTAAVRLWEARAARLRREGQTARALQADERTRGILSLLTRGPEAPDAAKECLLELLLTRLETASRRGEGASAEATAQEAKAALARYDGPTAETFRRRLERCAP